jgi:tetratricopeptide (TPR) repeat protein
MSAAAKPFFAQAIDAFKQGDRTGGIALLHREVSDGGGSRIALDAVLRLARHVGEIDLAIEAARRLVIPGALETLTAYWQTLADYGRSLEALDDIRRQPASIREHPTAVYFRGVTAAEWGQFEEAQELFRDTIAKAPSLTAAWLALATIKTFAPDDRDLAEMERLERQTLHSVARVELHYALGKAREDCGDVDLAFLHYSRAAAIGRRSRNFDSAEYGATVEDTIATYTPASMNGLIPSAAQEQRSLFVVGLPRSGTTLTQHILQGHSAVVDGAEVNLFGAARMVTLGLSFDAAQRYQNRRNGGDPWGDIGREYNRLIDMRFRASGLVVDKSLGQSLQIGILMHVLPDARIAWVRRSPDDVALSCFASHFANGLEWTWSLIDIADYLRAEDRLFDHWLSMFPDRILAVPYEDLVTRPGFWAERLQRHFGLRVESRIEKSSRRDRPISTASLSQVREAISTKRIGRAARFERHMSPFRDSYYA